MFLDAEPTALLERWPIIVEALQRAGHEVNPAKCHLWAGPIRDLPAEQRQAATQLSQLFPATEGAIKVMGTEAGAAYTTAVGDPAATAAAAQQRADAAIQLSTHIRELATTDLGIPRLGAAWTLFTECCVRAPDYDARLVPSLALASVTSALVDALRVTVSAVCAKDLPTDAWDQITLPGPLAGCGLRLPTAMADVALWASWDAHQERAREICADLGRSGDHAPADAEAAEAQRELARRGLHVQRGQRPTMTKIAERDFARTGWATSQEVRPQGQRIRQLGEGLRILESLRAGQLWQRLDGPGRTRILSAGGQCTGLTWTALPDTGAKAMPDEHWRICIAERLGLLRCPAGIPCGLPRARGRGRCGRIMDQGLRHVWHCKTGAARLRIHRGIQMTLVRELRQAGGHVDVERTMPSMAIIHEDGTIEESIMDLMVWWPGSMAWYGLDVTVRYAGSSRYYGAQHKAGAAARAAER